MKQQVAVEPISGALNKHKVQPVLVLGAGITADYAAQRLSSAHKIVQIKWGPVADLPLDWLLKQEALEKGRIESSWEKIKAVALLDWSGQVGEYILRIQLENGEVRDLRGKAVVIALDALPVSTLAWGWPGSANSSRPLEETITLSDLTTRLTPVLASSSGRPERDGLSVWAAGHNVGILLGPGGLEAAPNTLLAIKCALVLKQQVDCRVGIFYEELAVGAGAIEALYQESRQAGVEFYRYTEFPQVIEQEAQLRIIYRDPSLPDHFPPWEIPVTLIATATEYYPSKEIETVATLAGLPTGPDGFLLSDTLHAWGGQTNRKGIYCVGMARGLLRLMDLPEEVAGVAVDLGQGSSREKTLLLAQVDPLLCEVCLTCFRVCPHRAIEITDCTKRSSHGKLYKQAAWIHPEACQGCGICIAECPAQAINGADPLQPESKLDPDSGWHFFMLDNGELYQARTREDFSGNQGPVRLVVLACRQSGFLAVQTLTRLLPFYRPQLKLGILAEIAVYPVACAGWIDDLTVLRCLEDGADKVLICSCHSGACQHQYGNHRAKKRLRLTEQYLQEIGLKDRLDFYTLAGQNYLQWLTWLKKIINQLKSH